MSDALSSRLLEAIAEREQFAVMAGGHGPDGQWHHGILGIDDDQVRTQEGHLVVGEFSVPMGQEFPEQRLHIALNDPDSILRLCQAHREIVDLCRAEIDNGTDGAVTAESVLELLAHAYGIEEDSSGHSE